ELAAQRDLAAGEARGDQRERLGDERRERHRAAADLAVAGAAEHAADGLDHALYLRLDHRELARLLGGQVLAQEELGVAEHRVERGPQLVGDGGGHLPEGSQTLAAPDLELRAPELRVRLLELTVGVGQLARRL